SKMVYRVMFALGIGFVAYNGIDVLFSSLDSQVRSSLGGLTEYALAAARILKLDVSATILLSAYAVRVSMMTAKVALRGLS
ncbi:MAG: DUF2523 domain-containing protein, partial [Planctomycetaceae bacterium]|nr:DUF2523 domain-containing protein [Planctomycetaceae bacterium]